MSIEESLNNILPTLEYLPVLIYVIDNSSNILFKNHKLERYLDNETDTMFEYISPDYRDVFNTALMLANNTGERGAFEALFSDGEWYICFIMPLIEQGRTIIVASPITERKIASNKLRDSEHRYRTIFNTSPIPMIMVNNETKKISLINPSSCNLLGYTIESSIGMNINKIFPDITNISPVEKIFSTSCVTNDGSMRIVNIDIGNIKLNDEPHSVYFINDITHEILNAFRQEILVKNIIDTVILVDDTGIIHFSNRTIYEKSPIELKDTNICDYLPKKYKERIVDMINSVYNASEATPMIIKLDSVSEWTEMIFVPMKYEVDDDIYKRLTPAKRPVVMIIMKKIE